MESVMYVVLPRGVGAVGSVGAAVREDSAIANRPAAWRGAYACVLRA